MPGMSGWETLERLKKNEETADIPVVVLSVLSPATRTPDVPTTQGWVQKPFHETLLLTEISRALHPTSGPGRILLVEDDEDLATVVLSGFRTIGESGAIRIDHVSSLAEAESLLPEERAGSADSGSDAAGRIRICVGGLAYDGNQSFGLCRLWCTLAAN